MTTKRRVVWIVLGALLAVSLLVAAWPESKPPTASERAETISGQIRCPTCQGLSVAESDSPLAMNSRDEIDRRVNAGETDKQVQDYFVSRYGPSALMAPERQGVALIAWIAPVVFGVVASVGLVLVVRTWRKRPDTPISSEEIEAPTPASEPPTPKRPSVKRIAVDKRAVVGVCSIVLLVAAGALAINAGQREEGGQITGEFASDSNTLLSEAARFTAQGEPVKALQRYDAVIERDPANAQALAYRGWLVRLAGAPDEGLASIDAAIKAQPSYPDAYFFRGYIRLNDRNDPAAAVSDFETFLANNPPAEMKSLVESALTDARARVASR